ncbi:MULTISPECIES: bifunctional hydroxymethylpyrimidine kinase/phosphomethylpyrimidine kinase [unclassified Sphingomonas]|uniref:bifunctional hydroxymethylpyrimidine kinase/phosphomethylpyrimidine kinase n=1 Tax=unclassified Sphingomonas TaxID=196159 RepID=UPI0006F99926|nr:MULTISPECIES: bifunctional hydroxymethylpyrimidine kinase/phosphomethylpyrimidine kinase [unclassified Sphingomonas]KQM66624.1 phosphomethylpyrimidine kinase [Sphingomonas sp. Leaf16]KQN16657.1 phosphomethylpyrimidine kinase [Sphingomonas sp. Leaf29]KQN23436.1 phosphomethylpyrimidine kinase [Sphingomonas sp. Leaf32]
MTTPRILIVAGSDSGGGAGIQADIKTATMLGAHAMTAITAVTAQNTLGVDAVHPIPTDMVMAQIDAVVRDIGVDAIKIGMIGSARTAHALADRLRDLPGVPVVFDPVMISTSGARLADEATVAAFERLMAVATVATPNLPELAALGGVGEVLSRGCAVLEKGGHGEGEVLVDRLHQRGSGAAPLIEWSSPRIDGMATHGTGCTLSTAIACELAKEWTLVEAIGRARSFVRIAMLDADELGRGAGPMAQQGVRLDLNQSRWSPMLNQVTVPASDVPASEHFYRLLGLKTIVRSSRRYARFESEGGATFSIEMTDDRKVPAVYFEVGDLNVVVHYLKGQGLSFAQEPIDRPWGWREARLFDPAGNEVCLYQAGEMRRFPPWRIADA